MIRLAGLDPKIFINGDKLFKEFKGALAENYVAQCLQSRRGTTALYYWTSDGKAELDYVIQHGNNMIPIEVKSGDRTKAKSLTIYKQKYKPRLRVRVSNLNLDLTDDLLNIPLFYADRTDQLINKVI